MVEPHIKLRNTVRSGRERHEYSRDAAELGDYLNTQYCHLMALIPHDAPTGPNVAQVLTQASQQAEEFTPVSRRASVAIVICMDNRLNPHTIFGLQEGDTYVIRNAGGILTDDVRRSLSIAQHCLGVEEILLIHHTDCGMEGLCDQSFASELAHTTGTRPTWRPGGFTRAEDDVREMLNALATDPHIPAGAHARGFVFNVEDGSLTEIWRENSEEKH